MRNLFCAAVLLTTAIFFGTARAAEVVPVNYMGDENLIYPFILTENRDAEKKINAEIDAEIKKFLAGVEETAADGNFSQKTVTINYEIPCNYEFGILSVILIEYVNFRETAHPSIFCRALNFNSDSGQRIFSDSLSEIANDENGESCYSPKNLTLKLKKYAAENNIHLYEDFQELTKIPDDFYFDKDLHVHFIFQQYEFAPYAAGIIEFDATPIKSDKRAAPARK